MVNVALIALLTLLTFAVQASIAGNEIANIQSWLNEGSQGYYKADTGDQWVRNVDGNGDRYIKVSSGFDYRASNGREYPVSIEKTGKIDVSTFFWTQC